MSAHPTASENLPAPPRSLPAGAGSPISAWWATWKYQLVNLHKPNVPDDQVTVPPVLCGKGYRQLEWLEEIRATDEFFGGKREKPKWVPVGSSGSRYRPRTANSSYAPWAIIRRKENRYSPLASRSRHRIEIRSTFFDGWKTVITLHGSDDETAKARSKEVFYYYRGCLESRIIFEENVKRTCADS